MNKIFASIGLLMSAVAVAMSQLVTFDTHFAELDSAKMIHTTDSNYAICHPNLPSNWRSVSVNSDELTIITKANQIQTRTLSSLIATEKSSLNTIKNQLMTIVISGPFNVKSQTGLAKLTTFDRNGGTSSMGSGGSSSSSSSSASSSGSGGMSVSRSGPNSYIISKQDFPFNWHRIFVNDDLTTIVYRTGRVIMSTQSLFKQDEREKLIALRQEVDKTSQITQQLTSAFTSTSTSSSSSNTSPNTFKSPFDFVNQALGGMFG